MTYIDINHDLDLDLDHDLEIDIDLDLDIEPCPILLPRLCPRSYQY